MTVTHYIGFDVHKKSVNFCIKTADGEIVEEGTILAQRDALRQWARERKHPWKGAMELTLAQRLDLRHAQALRRGTTHSASGKDEIHYRWDCGCCLPIAVSHSVVLGGRILGRR